MLLALLLHSGLRSQYQLATVRNQNLGPGINANRWLTRDFSNFEPWLYTESDFQKMHELGFGHVRLPVGFQNWLDPNTYVVYDSLYVFIDSALTWSIRHDLRLVLDFHPEADEDGILLNPNNANYGFFKTIMARIWKKTALRYQHINPNRLYYDIYNEPNYVNENQYTLFAKQVIDSIRTVDNNKTIIVEGVLTNFNAINDTNVIATIHFYNPGIFTHQGAEWGAVVRNTIGVPFPYDSTRMPALDPQDATDPFTVYQYNNYNYFGTEQYLQVLINWNVTTCRDERPVPVYCGEFGVSGDAPVTDKLFWITSVRQILDSMDVSWASWCWKGNGDYASFQLFDCNYCIDEDSVITDSLYYTELCALGLSNACPLSGVFTSIKELSERNVRLFPNPGHSFVYTNLSTPCAATVLDVFGRQLKTQFFSSTIPLDLSGFPNGVYFVVLSSESKECSHVWIKQ